MKVAYLCGVSVFLTNGFPVAFCDRNACSLASAHRQIRHVKLARLQSPDRFSLRDNKACLDKSPQLPVALQRAFLGC